jgi:PAS domain S-box-containing protein
MEEAVGTGTIVQGFVCSPLDVESATGGFLFGSIDLSQMLEVVTGNLRSGKTGYAWVIDEAGAFLYHPERDFIGKNAFEARKERGPYISFKRINQIMKDQMLQGREGKGTYESGWHRGIEGKVTKLIAFTPVRSRALSPSQAWSVAVAAPTSEVAEVVRRVYLRHLGAEAALIAGMFLFALLVVIYQHRISRGLKERVSRQEEVLTSILQNSMDAIVFVDKDNRVQIWNRGAELIFGYSSEDMVGRSFHRLIPPELEADEELERIQEEVIERGFIRNYRAPRVTKDGRRITIDLTRTLIRGNEGKPIGSTAIMKDVTEEMELEHRIYNTEKLASIGILAAGVAHEINNPLAIALGFTDLLLERFDPKSPEYDDLKIVEETCNHAKKIVEDLLGFARISEGQEETTNVGISVKTVVNIVKNTLLTKKIELIERIEDGLPPVLTDPREFQQVVFNLINNAMAAMEEKGGRLTVSAYSKNGHVVVDVSDTGAGIPDKIKPRIFDPFFTTKKVGEGTGLGLSLCYGILKKYGGTLTFTSLSNEDNPDAAGGSTFTVSMPACPATGSGGGNSL